MSETKLFAVTGKPVFHSRSPHIFNSLFREIEMDAIYMRLAAENSAEALKTAKAMNLAGLNVTSPYKEEMIKILDEVDDQALEVDAVNCIVNQNNGFIGYNTDATGAARALETNDIKPKNKRAAILGAGGAARAAAYGLLKAGAEKVVLLNRSEERAKKAAQRLGCDYAPLEKAEDVLKKSDILISCLPVHNHIIDPKFLKKTLVVMDANYKDSKLIQAAKETGCRIISGLEWLLHQALPAFHLFTGEEVPQEILKKLWKDGIMNRPMNKPNIALIGFMGSGKTAVGSLLAEKEGFEFFDSDAFIEKSQGMKITEIFRKKGESFFREYEKSIIKKQIPSAERRIFSLGGGAVLDKENRKIISQYCHVIWLWVSVPTALKRINISSRPLLTHHDSEKSIEKIHSDRIPLYAQTSDLVIDSEAGSAQEIARRIKNEMG